LLRARERQLHDFAEISSDWFWEQDADMRFRWMSQTALFNLMSSAMWARHDGSLPSATELRRSG
jgi:hypothetical protein